MTQRSTDRSGEAPSDPVEGASCGTCELKHVERLLVVGDVQANYDPLALLLESAGLLAWDGDTPHWAAGAGVLLLLGDLLDGGAQPAEVLWLVITLANAAAAAGGRVVLLKGNHEHMLLGSLVDAEAPRAREWFTNGGLETLARLAHARGRAISASLQSAMFAPTFGPIGPDDPEVEALLAFVRQEYASELAFIGREARAAALVNGSVLAVHAGPNFEAESWAAFAPNAEADIRIAWRRDWLEGWSASHDNRELEARMRALKASLDDAGLGIALEHVVFGHTPLRDLEIRAFGGRQCRVGRIVAPAQDLPAVYDVLTLPRGVPRGGAIGGLEFGPQGIVAIYSDTIDDGVQRWPAREVVDSTPWRRDRDRTLAL